MKSKWIIAAGFCIVIAAIAIPRFFVDRDLPEKLHGVWETTEPKYENRYFLLEKNAIGFGTGDGELDRYVISRVDKTVRRHKTLYTLEYKMKDGTVFKRSLYYESANGGIIQFENQANIAWTLTGREKPPPVSAEQ
jgi:hypothetical protein